MAQQKNLDELVTSYMEGAGRYLTTRGVKKPTTDQLVAMAQLRATVRLLTLTARGAYNSANSAALAQFLADDGKGWRI